MPLTSVLKISQVVRESGKCSGGLILRLGCRLAVGLAFLTGSALAEAGSSASDGVDPVDTLQLFVVRFGGLAILVAVLALVGILVNTSRLFAKLQKTPEQLEAFGRILNQMSDHLRAIKDQQVRDTTNRVSERKEPP